MDFVHDGKQYIGGILNLDNLKYAGHSGHDNRYFP